MSIWHPASAGPPFSPPHPRTIQLMQVCSGTSLVASFVSELWSQMRCSATAVPRNKIMPSQQSWRTPTSHFDGTYTRDTLGASSRAPAAISDTTDEHCAVVTVSPSEQEVRTRWSMVQFAAGGTETASAAQQVTTIAAVAATYTKLVGMLVMQARGWPRVGTDAWCGTLEDRAPAVGGGEQPQVFCSWQSQAPVF